MTFSRKGFWAALGLALPAAGCAAVGPDYLRPAAIVPVQFKEIKGWKAATPRDDAAGVAWWKVFHDRELDMLEPQVAISNQTLKADEANYREALALIAEARAGLFPVLNINPSFTRSGAGSTAGNILNAELSGSWMPDVWGRVRRAIEEQGAAAQVSAADLAFATLSEQSSLATAYVQVLLADAAGDLFARTVKEYQHSLQITQNQYNAGTAAKSDVITAQALLLAAQAQEIAVGVTRAQSEHAVALLMGRPPSDLSIPHSRLPDSIPSVPVQLPSALLERRPDIAAEERIMKEQNAAIGVAMAGYYPDITLSGAFGFSGDPFSKTVSVTNPVWSYGLSLAQPLFNGGLTDAQVEAARQAYRSSVAAYRNTVLTAFQQVEDQLAAVPILTRQLRVQDEAVKAARQAVQIALNEYSAGTQSFTTVVTNEATALSDEETALTTRAQRLTDVVLLIEALGGGWTTADLPNPSGL
ncbi:MAG: efflux transporter outer membrane subunit [Hyphomicrobiales bacterium]|nr:efflux transporter outer membrane subunit [Hyphomicrobiales bacterium]